MVVGYVLHAFCLKHLLKYHNKNTDFYGLAVRTGSTALQKVFFFFFFPGLRKKSEFSGVEIIFFRFVAKNKWDP